MTSAMTDFVETRGSYCSSQVLSASTSGLLFSWRTRSRSSALRPLMSRSMSNSASKRLTASSAIGEIAAAFFPRRALAAMSASSLRSLALSGSDYARGGQALHRRWQGLPHEQCGRACSSRICAGRKSWLFAGADRAAAMTTLIMTAKLNDVDPQAWLAECARPNR